MLLLLGGFLLLMLLGLPVALAMAVSSLVYILVTGITPDEKQIAMARARYRRSST